MSKLKPYPKQNKAIQNIITTFKKDDRTQLIKSCGTGKSLVSMWTHEKFVSSLDKSITILFYPSLFLVNQTYNTYKDNTTLGFNPLVVCSDKAIGENENDDVFEIDANEVKYPVTTNVEDIKTYLQNKSIKDKIVFVTYQSSQLVGQALNELNIKADLGIFDEAHKTATANIDSKFAYGLKDENIPIAKRLFMTATPRHIKFNVDSEEDEEVEVFSMNNPELYGNITYEYPMREAINDGIITDYKIVGILIDDKYIDSYTNKVKPYSEDVINEAKIKAVNEAMNKYGLNKALIFNTDINASKELEKYSNTSIFNKTIKHLDGKSKHSYREQVLKELKDNEQYVITNARLFTEGVDLPSIDMIALFRNVKSEIDIIQTVGRVQRIDKNNPKKIGYILLPIFISNVDNIDEELKTNKDLLYTYEIINSLKENDEQLRATLEFKKQNKSNSKSNKIDAEKIENPNFEIDYISSDTNLSNDYIKEINEKITHKIETVILDEKGNYKSDKEWKELFVQYIKEYGFEKLNSTTVYKNEFIGVKITRLKTLYSKSSLQKKELMKVVWDCFPKSFFILKEYKNDDKWKNLFIEYDKEIGFENLNAKTKYKKASLGDKLAKIRHNYNNSTLEKQKELIEFWDCIPHSLLEKRENTNDEWKELFIKFINEKGADSLTTTLVYQNENLGNKINTIRAIYSKASPEEQKEMEDYWDCIPKKMWGKIKKSDKEWREVFTKFIKEFGFSKLTFSAKYEDMNIGHKFQHFKNRYRKATPKKQKEMRDFWDCFPDEFWNQKGL